MISRALAELISGGVDLPPVIETGAGTAVDPTGTFSGSGAKRNSAAIKAIVSAVVALENKVDLHKQVIDTKTDVEGTFFAIPTITMAQFTADQADMVIEPTHMQPYRIDADALGPWNVSGIVPHAAGQRIWFTNHGANTINFTDQDAASAAGNRIITGTGAAVALAQDQSIEMYYDDITLAWRVM